MTELRTHESIAKAEDVLQVRFVLPDLEKAERFLVDFGLKTSRDKGTLRGHSSERACVYQAHQGDAAFEGFVLIVGEGDCARLAEHGTSGEFDFGSGVCLQDPDGWNVYAVEAGHGFTPGVKVVRNENGHADRRGSRYQVTPGPSDLRRLGHVVLQAADFGSSLAWYQKHFGLLVSDAITFDGSNDAGAFLRCDRGADLVDHHSLFLMQNPQGKPAFEHAAFEVRDFDSLMAGSSHLKSAGREQTWGVGRHILGAHIFDYWRDPFGFELEHWTDGDLLDASDPAGRHGAPELLGTQWGPPHPLTQGGAA
jgi:catechol 2,3-dioxygenase-like lactoylglutathione lyase family enzyme